ncbi:protein of unknown function [Paraburkholderia kururiensis]
MVSFDASFDQGAAIMTSRSVIF